MAKSKNDTQSPKLDTLSLNNKIKQGKVGKKKKPDKFAATCMKNAGQSSSPEKQTQQTSKDKVVDIIASPQNSNTAEKCNNTTQENNSSVGHKRKRKASKKNPTGMSNWASLCAELKIDPTRKKKPQVKDDKESEKELNSEPKPSRPEVWFDNVDKFLIERDPATAETHDTDAASEALVKPESYKGATHCVAMDCEMVGVGEGGEESILARVSIVNHYGVCLYDKFVLPTERVTDYRTHVSGITKENIKTGEEFTKVQKEVSDIIKGKILVGHALHNDLKVLFLAHPHKMIRDTSKYKPFRQIFKGKIPSLKKLADTVLGVSVQEGQHSSVQDAQATMRLYTMYRQKWEKELKQVWKQDKRRLKKKKPKLDKS